MDLFYIVGSETHPEYRRLETANLARQYDFLDSLISVDLKVGIPLTESLIKVLNFQAIAGLHEEAGRYRTKNVTVETYTPPDHALIPCLMKVFLAELEDLWDYPPDLVAAFAFWKINHIHPFINGNGRTAGAVAYFVFCKRLGTELPGAPILPERLRREPARAEAIQALKECDAGGSERLISLIKKLVDQQVLESPGPPL